MSLFCRTLLYFALMNAIVISTNQVLPLLEQLTSLKWDRGKLLQSPYFFHPSTLRLFSPPPLPTGILYSPQFHSHRDTKMAAHQTQWSTSTISQKNRRLLTVYLRTSFEQKRLYPFSQVLKTAGKIVKEVFVIDMWIVGIQIQKVKIQYLLLDIHVIGRWEHYK